MPAWVVDLLNRLNSTFVVDGRWQWFVSGLGYTLLISLFSVFGNRYSDGTYASVKK